MVFKYTVDYMYYLTDLDTYFNILYYNILYTAWVGKITHNSKTGKNLLQIKRQDDDFCYIQHKYSVLGEGVGGAEWIAPGSHGSTTSIIRT